MKNVKRQRMSGVLPFRLLFTVKLPAGYNLEQIVTKSGEVKTAVWE